MKKYQISEMVSKKAFNAYSNSDLEVFQQENGLFSLGIRSGGIESKDLTMKEVEAIFESYAEDKESVPVFETNCNTTPDFYANPDDYQNKKNENAEPTSRCLSGTNDFWAAEEWAEPVIAPDGREATKYYLFTAEDITDDDGNALEADCYPWDAKHVSRIVIND